MFIAKSRDRAPKWRPFFEQETPGDRTSFQEKKTELPVS
jgi:hypothetical protein